ncbi:MAG: DUF1778 domain-containing protein [Clostridiales Family XIII bacterium]|jgi:uncharacterized protein (DUF1778 family)|nr:DUF1778 domain-containing protein [Clostridiales Family XIII bacterium]
MGKTRMLNLRTTEEDYLAVQNLARFQGKNISEFVMDAIRAQIEDWEDIQAILEYQKEKAEGKIQTVSWENVQRELGL